MTKSIIILGQFTGHQLENQKGTVVVCHQFSKNSLFTAYLLLLC